MEGLIREALARLDSIERALNAPQREYLDNAGAAEFTNISTAQLELWRSAGGGPRFIKMGRKVLYRISDLREFLDAHVQEPLQ